MIRHYSRRCGKAPGKAETVSLGQICHALAGAGANVDDAYIFSHPESEAAGGFPLLILVVSEPEDGATAFAYDVQRQRYSPSAKLPFLTDAEYKTAIDLLMPAVGRA